MNKGYKDFLSHISHVEVSQAGLVTNNGRQSSDPMTHWLITSLYHISTYTSSVDLVGKFSSVRFQEFYALGCIHQLLKTFIIESCPCGTLPFDHLSLCWKYKNHKH